MLETKDLVKIYKPKKGVPVKALNGVSLKFPDKGMVFLLGKSGSGKSTLLNVLGGLDRYESGEIRIKGVSSKEFKQQHFDSYRNTYVGFIFQEYNILEEFTVGANIALALQLQGKKATDEAINAILREVDLEGYGARKPNELSGGQKQRVAIARALVKSPEIIMADEPSGALDSATGKQIFDTLKKLSREKLVIVVSHDREFAEQYADRIIELADGTVINDMERQSSSEAPKEEGISYDGNAVSVPMGYHLTEEDRIAINEYLDALATGITITAKKSSGSNEFKETDPTKIKQSEGTFQLIKSRLPMPIAFRMGASGLNHKKIRLTFTILLACVAFCLFGLADTFAAYNHIKTCTRSILDSQIRYASVGKTAHVTEGEWEYETSTKLNQEDLDRIEQETGVSLTGVYVPGSGNLNFAEQVGNEDGRNGLYRTVASGFVEVNGDMLSSMGATLTAGTLPRGDRREIALSEYLSSAFVQWDYLRNGTVEKIASPSDMVGKTLTLNGEEYTVTGIIDTGLDLTRYELLEKDMLLLSDAERLLYYALNTEFNYAVSNSLSGMVMVGEGGIDRIRSTTPTYSLLMQNSWPFTSQQEGVDLYLPANFVGSLENNTHLDILWLDGVERTKLGDKEIVLPGFMLDYYLTAQEPEKYNYGYLSQEKDPDWSYLAKLPIAKHMTEYVEETDSFQEVLDEGYRIAGIITTNLSDEFLILSDAELQHLQFDTGTWDHAIGVMPQSEAQVETLVEFCNTKQDDGTAYNLVNPVSFELEMANEVLQLLADVFLWIGLGFALFSALLLSNFIGTSIAYKKQQIGILRAIGSRGNDVFRIFFSESFIIAMINFVLSALGTFIITLLINHSLRSGTGLLITLLSFGPRQVVLLLGISLLIAAIASFLPVKKAASKRPIDAIRNR